MATLKDCSSTAKGHTFGDSDSGKGKMQNPLISSPALKEWSTSEDMQATEAAIASVNQLAKDLAIRSAKASELKAKNKSSAKPLSKQRASKFSAIVNQRAKLQKARKKVMAETALAAGVSGPPRLIISHLEARNFLAREIRNDDKDGPVAFLFCGSEQISTGRIKPTSNPIWKDKIVFGSESNILESKTLHIQVKDPHAKKGNDNLGGITVDLSKMLKDNVLRKKLQWYDLKPVTGMTKAQGQVRFSLRYNGKIFLDRKNSTKNRENKENGKPVERPLGIVMKKRATKTKAMAAFQAHRVLEAEKRELEALEKAKAEMQKLKKLEMDKRALEEQLEKVQAEKNIMEAQVHIMKEEQANLFVLPRSNKNNVINPEETIHLEIEDGAVRCGAGRKSQASLDNLERQMTRSIARLRQGHTRQNGMAEIRAMAEGLLEADIPVVLKCLRSASNVHEGVFQRECVKVVGLFARTCPNVIAPHLDSLVDAVCSRINVKDEVVHTACIESIGSLARRVLPILTRGRVKPSFSAILDPLLELVNKHGNSIIGEISAKCLQGAFSLDIPKQDMVSFKILGIPDEQREIDVARRTFRSHFPKISLPKKMSVRADGVMVIEVPTEMASSYYQKLLDSTDSMPPGWCLAASADATAAAVAAKAIKLSTKPGKNGSVPEIGDDEKNLSRNGQLMRQHVILMGGCGKEIFRRILETVPNAKAETLSALLDCMSVIINAACYGESRRIRRLSNAVAFAAPSIMQHCVDTLLAPNKSYIWRARRSSLLLLGKVARLHAVSINSGQITSNVQIIDGEVDVVVILKAIKDCTTDRINVVRKVAAQAMEEFQNANVIPPAFMKRFGKKPVPDKPKIRRAGERMTSRSKQSIRKSSQNAEALHDSQRAEKDAVNIDERPLSREVHRRVEKKVYPTRYKSRAPEGYTGVDADMLPAPPPEDPKPSNSTCLQKLDRRQQNSLQRAADACLKRPSMLLTVLRNVDKRGNFGVVMPHLILSEALKTFDEKKITSMLHIVGPDASQRILHSIATSLNQCVNSVYTDSNNMATHVLLKWSMALLNTCIWSVDQIIFDEVPAWKAVKASMRLLGGTTSNCDGAAKAATLYALLSTKDLLDSHLYIFGDEGESGGSESDD